MRTLSVLLPLASLLVSHEEWEREPNVDWAEGIVTRATLRCPLAPLGFNPEIDTVVVTDDDSALVVRREVELPCSFSVCPRCDGHGSILTPSIGEHAYSSEEFNETFHDDEDREAYFTRGGKYDVTCPVCSGKNVVPTPDREAIKRSNDPLLGFALAKLDQDAEDMRQEAAERRREAAYGY